MLVQLTDPQMHAELEVSLSRFSQEKEKHENTPIIYFTGTVCVY